MRKYIFSLFFFICLVQIFSCGIIDELLGPQSKHGIPTHIIQLRPGCSRQKHLEFLKELCSKCDYRVYDLYEMGDFLAYSITLDQECEDKLKNSVDVVAITINTPVETTVHAIERSVVDGAKANNLKSFEKSASELKSKEKKEEKKKDKKDEKKKEKKDGKKKDKKEKRDDKKKCSRRHSSESGSCISSDSCSSFSTSSCHSLCVKEPVFGCEVQMHAPTQLTSLMQLASNVDPVPEDKASLLAVSLPYIYPKTQYVSTAFVLNTGVYARHPDLCGRAIRGNCFVPDEKNFDLNGSGTLIAGVIAGTNMGVSKTSRIVSVKVLDREGKGFVSQVLSGLEYVYKLYCKKKCRSSRYVIDLSIIGPVNVILNNAIKSVSLKGIFVSNNAGAVYEEGASLDAADYSVASVVPSITSAAVSINLTWPIYNVFGESVAIIAVGDQILSTFRRSKYANDPFPLSFADGLNSAVVSGVACLLYSLITYNQFSPDQIRQVLLSLATPDLITFPVDFVGDQVNLVLSIYPLIQALGCVPQTAASLAVEG